MKILVVSLLRLGDLIQQITLLKGLRSQYPQAEIHLLANRQFAQVEKILASVVDRYIYFDREAVQKGLGEPGYNILWSYSQVESLVEKLNLESYDRALNLTHNKLSAYLMGALTIDDKRGLFHQEGHFQGLSNRWLRYFNDRFSGTQPSLFQYVELLSKAFSVPVSLSQEASGSPLKNKLVLLHCLTSDDKKNWGLEKFAALKRTIEISLVDYKVQILGAPFEREALTQVFSDRDLLICDLVEVQQHLQNAALLVTGDTSVKHLAAQLGTAIVEIAIGSSDATKTAALSERSIVLHSTVPCAPCVHGQKCSQQSHLCAAEVSVERVFEAVWTQLSHGVMPAMDLGRRLDRAVWTLYLDKLNVEAEPEYQRALESLQLASIAKEREDFLAAWMETGRIHRDWYNKIFQALPSRDVLLSTRHFQSSDISELILCAQNILKSQKDTAGYFQSFMEALLARYAHPVQIIDRVNSALAEIDELLTIRETLTRYLQTLSREGAYYAKGIGQLPITGFEETGKSLPRDFEESGLQSRSREDATP